MIKKILWNSKALNKFQIYRFTNNIKQTIQNAKSQQKIIDQPKVYTQASHLISLLQKKKTVTQVKQVVQTNEKKFRYNPWQAIRLLKAYSHVGFNQSIDISLKLNVNPRNGQQIVRGNAIMPSGIGKKVKVAVFCPEQYAQICKQAGADIIGDSKLIEEIKQNKIHFDKLYSTPQLVGILKPFAKNLGPKGLMPNIKVGTLVTNQKLKEAILQAKAGEIIFKVDSARMINAMIAKIQFSQQQIIANLRSFMRVISEKKPASIKGKYIIDANIKTTMSPRVKLNIDSIDPRSKHYLLNIN